MIFGTSIHAHVFCFWKIGRNKSYSPATLPEAASEVMSTYWLQKRLLISSSSPRANSRCIQRARSQTGKELRKTEKQREVDVENIPPVLIKRNLICHQINVTTHMRCRFSLKIVANVTRISRNDIKTNKMLMFLIKQLWNILIWSYSVRFMVTQLKSH